MILSKNSDVKSIVVKAIEGKPMYGGELLVKPLIKGEHMTFLEIHYTRRCRRAAARAYARISRLCRQRQSENDGRKRGLYSGSRRCLPPSRGSAPWGRGSGRISSGRDQIPGSGNLIIPRDVKLRSARAEEESTMADKAKYLMIASMDVDKEHEAVFNEVYDQEHVPNLSKVPGVLGITRYKRETLTMNIGGERKTIEIPNEPVYTAIYELASAGCANESRLGQSHRRRPLAGPGQTLHKEPAARAAENYGVACRRLKKPHMLRCARSSRSNVLALYASARRFSRASPQVFLSSLRR